MSKRPHLALLLAGLVHALVTPIAVAQTSNKLTYQPAPVDNPLKGLVPYQGDVRNRFPHSLEFNYIAYSDLVKDFGVYDWDPFERLLNDVASRGHQAVIRIYLEYPKKRDVIPPFLINAGLKVHRYLNTNTQPFPPAEVETPDYEDVHLRRSLREFIAAFGKRYDNDPRLGFITAGLLGTWGEWHTYPRDDLFASKAVQQEVMDAYESAFQITPILLRYPAGPHDAQKSANSDRRFGYHDDSFAWATLHTGKQEEDWFFMTALKQAGQQAEVKWKSQPIGGEIRPEAWGIVFDENPSNPQVQDFLDCVQATHVSWLLDSGMFEKKQSPNRIQRAIEQVRKMGYEFHIRSATLELGETKDSSSSAGSLKASVEVENRGLAPFYYPWLTEYALFKSETKLPTKTFQGNGQLIGLLPNQPSREWQENFDLQGVPSGSYTLAIRIPNPLKQGNPVRFANAEQDQDSPTWCSLGIVEVPKW
jgi:hypothetical protein